MLNRKSSCGYATLKIWFFPLKCEFFRHSSGLGERFSLTFISQWKERRIQNKSRVTVIVRVNEAEN
jgi:hypothetical protein